MKITKAKLKQIIKEELEEGGYAGHYIRDEEDPDGILARFNHREKVLKSIQALDYLKMKAKDYHNDPTLNPGDIKALLQDDFMDSPYPQFFEMDEGEPSVADKINDYAAGEGLNEVKKMKITKTQLKQIIKEELEVTLTNEEAGEMFGEEVQAQLEEQEEPLNEDASYAEALQLVGQTFAQMASTFGPVMIAGLFLKVAKDAFTKARSEDPVATQTDTDRVGDLFELEQPEQEQPEQDTPLSKAQSDNLRAYTNADSKEKALINKLEASLLRIAKVENLLANPAIVKAIKLLGQAIGKAK